MVFSKDAGQRYMYVADGTDNVVWILDHATGKTLGHFGSNGKYAGQFHWINAIGTDRQGNIYTGDVEQSKRIQKFVPVMADAKK
jgi:DNA-binding beta-propeller fold protein YncE